MKNYLENSYAGVFEPDDVKLLTSAFSAAWKTVRASGVYLDGSAEKVREVLAKQIVKEAMSGERELHQLRDGALAQLAKDGILDALAK